MPAATPTLQPNDINSVHVAFSSADRVEFHVTIRNGWELEVGLQTPQGKTPRALFQIAGSERKAVTAERCDALPDFNENAWGGWQKGYALNGVRAQECTIKGALDVTSVRVTDSTRNCTYRVGKDFKLDADWGALGRCPGSSIDPQENVQIDYDFFLQRIDTVVLSSGNSTLRLKTGIPHLANPEPPHLQPDEVPLFNIHVTGNLHGLSRGQLFPILETAFPNALAATDKGCINRLLPALIRKLHKGEPIKILTWGDSVTEEAFLSESERWPAQFATRLIKLYPKANFKLITEAWAGHNTSHYLHEPPGSRHHYQEKVLDAGADLIIMEFINDADMTTGELNERYGRFLADFKKVGSELILFTPHYMHPDWMKFPSQDNPDTSHDPREYVSALRLFAARNHIPLADVSLRYGRLWRQGIPYQTWMLNGINHPNARGMSIYTDALIQLFDSSSIPT
jgi:hypothetical protein